MKLPVDDLLPQILRALRESKHVVIEAPPGAGKTTRVPPALLEFGDVLILEPRRLAARMAARRVASELGERVGETVGYQVRFEDVTGPRTRLRFLTEGVLTRRLLSDPKLRGTSVVVLDEFHERHLDTDLALALVKRLDVRVVVTAGLQQTRAVMVDIFLALVMRGRKAVGRREAGLGRQDFLDVTAGVGLIAHLAM